jgi:hypothetical protein
VCVCVCVCMCVQRLSLRRLCSGREGREESTWQQEVGEGGERFFQVEEGNKGWNSAGGRVTSLVTCIVTTWRGD